MIALAMLAPAPAAGPVQPDAGAYAAPQSPPVEGPAQETPSVTVTARRIQHIGAVEVVATNWCPNPDPVRYAADRPPQVTDTFPRDGATIPPGPVQVRASFDAPMSCYAEVAMEGGARDPCEPEGTWVLPDRRSFLLQCRLEPGVAYTLRFARVRDRGFVGLSDRSARPYVLHFTTTTDAPAPSWRAVEAADPGPPDARRASAYVTCTDTGPAATVCSHQRFDAPPSPTPPP